MKSTLIQIISLSLLIISTSVFSATKNGIDKSSPKLANKVVSSATVKVKPSVNHKRIDKASTKSSNPIYQSEQKETKNPLYQSSQLKPKLPKVKATGLATGKRTNVSEPGKAPANRPINPRGI